MTFSSRFPDATRKEKMLIDEAFPDGDFAGVRSVGSMRDFLISQEIQNLMRIGVDAHILTEKFQGSRVYLLNILRRLAKIDRHNEYVLYSHSPEQTRALFSSVGDRFDHRLLRSHGPVGRLLFEFPRLEKRDKLDLLYNQYISPPFGRCRRAVTIHDILFELLPQFFSPLFVARSRLFIRRSAQRASVVFTDSQFSRQALLERYAIPAEKIHITYCAVDHDLFHPLEPREWPSAAEQFRPYRPFIFFVGRLDPRKNLRLLIEALASRKRRGKLAEKLLITGCKDYRHREVFQAIERHNLENEVVFLGGVDDQLLPLLYNMAEVFVFPSWGEGFGLPVLEAMACGTPVITTDRGSLAEVAGDAAFLVDPSSLDSLEEALDKVLSHPHLRQSLREKGLGQAKKFDWGHSARVFYEALQRLA